MGLGDFFKNIFGKKTCAFCGKEVGMMKRTKIKNGDFICSDCDDMCSFHIQKYRFTKDELSGHMEYMRRQNELFEKYVSAMKSDLFPSAYSDMAIEFFDDAGMFRIRDRRYEGSGGKSYPVELFRYDTVSSYEAYLEENEPAEQGGKKTFKECGIKIKFLGTDESEDMQNTNSALRSHPYIDREIKIVFANSDRDRENCEKYIDNAIFHFDYIFGVNDDRRGLFSFGMTKKEKRDLMGTVAFAKTAFEAAKAAKNGGEISEEKKAEIQKNMDAMADAESNGLSVYSRRADALEEKLQ